MAGAVADVRDRTDPRRSGGASRCCHRRRSRAQTRPAEKGDGDPDGGEPGQRRGRAVAVLHRGGSGRGQQGLHLQPAAAVRLQRRTGHGSRCGAGLHHVVDPPQARASRAGDDPGSGGAVRGVHLRRASARLGCAGSGGRRIRGGPRIARRRLSDPAAGAVRLELRRRDARGVRIRLHRAAVAVRPRRSARGTRVADRGRAGVRCCAGGGTADPAGVRCF